MPGQAPDVELASQVADALVEASLLASDAKERFQELFASGQLDSATWKRMYEETPHGAVLRRGTGNGRA